MKKINVTITLVAFVSTILLFAIIANHNRQATNSTTNVQYGLVSPTTGKKEITQVKKEPVKKDVAANVSSTGSTASKIWKSIVEVIANILKVAVCVVLVVLFRKLPKGQQKAILKGLRTIVMIFLSIVSLGIFMGVRTWNNDR